MKFGYRLIAFIVCLSGAAVAADAAVQDCNSVNKQDNSRLEYILENIGEASSNLKTFQSDLSYLLIQDPDIVESTTLQTGKLYYEKGQDRSRLRIRFDTQQQDDFPPEPYIEDFTFDGVWLTRVNYKLEQVSRYQQAPEDKPADVLELINDRFPLIGFSGADTLRKDFNITLIEASRADPNEPVQLLLDVKVDSEYRDNYKKIDFWIAKNNYLPLRVRAYSTQGDIHDVRFSAIKVNKKLKNGVFTVETPSGFRENIEALETAP